MPHFWGDRPFGAVIARPCFLCVLCVLCGLFQLLLPRWPSLSERSSGQTPVPVADGLFLRRKRLLGPVAGMLRPVFIRGMIAQPELMVLVAAAPDKIVVPAARFAFARQQRLVAQTAPPQLGVELAVREVIGMQDVKTPAGQPVQQLPELGGDRLIGELVGWQDAGAGAVELVDGTLSAFGLFSPHEGGSLLTAIFVGPFLGTNLGIGSGQPERVGIALHLFRGEE